MKESIRTLRTVRPAVYPAFVHTALLMDVRFPIRVYWQAAWLLSVVLGLSLIGLLVLSGSQAEPLNPLLPYTNLMPGHTRDDALQQGAVCGVTAGPVYSEQCSLTPDDGPFEKVTLTIQETQIVAANFTVRRGSLFAGDLERLWGKPIVYSTPKNETLLLQWSAYHISATATQQTPSAYSIRFLSVNHIISYQ